MGTGNFTDEFKRDSLYAWKRKFAKAATGETDKDVEVRRLMRELARASEERDILKKGEPCPPSVRGQWRARIPPGMQGEIRVRGRASRAVFRQGHVPVPAHPTERVLCMA